MTKLIKKTVILTLVLTAAAFFIYSAAVPAQEHSNSKNAEIPAAANNNTREETQVPPPPFSEDIFPCSECHADMEPNPQRRVLEDAHDDIVLKHDEQNRWCLDCHDEKNRDVLHLADGSPVDFKESYKLCGQCHGPKLRDWRRGVHGRRTGSWNGSKQYLLCAHCHDPHAPGFKGLKPEPPPKRPGGDQ